MNRSYDLMTGATWEEVHDTLRVEPEAVEQAAAEAATREDFVEL